MLVSNRLQCWDWSCAPFRISQGPVRLPDDDLSNPMDDAAQFDARLTQLLQRVGRGDRAAFQALYHAESSRLYGLALRITRQPALAADAVHDAFLQAWQRAGRFDATRGSAAAWLTGLVRYRAIDAMRKRTREVTGAAVPEEEDPGPGALDALLASAAGRALHHCLGFLEPRQRQAILLAFVDGLSHAELAAHLAMPLGTVKSWIRRGLASLKGCLEP